MIPTSHKFLLTYALLIFFPWSAHAHPEDRHALLHLHAEQASLNQHTHQGEYTGDVSLDQGSTHLRAYRAMTQSNTHHQLVIATASGNPERQAHFWITPNTGQQALHAYADIIRYKPAQHEIELQGHARLVQGQQTFLAPYVRYNLRTQHVITTPHAHERTIITLQTPKQP